MKISKFSSVEHKNPGKDLQPNRQLKIIPKLEKPKQNS